MRDSDVAGLRAEVSGAVLLPGAPGYSAEAACFEQSVEHHPALIVAADGPADVMAAVRFAAAHGLTVAVQSTGHGVGPAATDAVLVSTRRMNDARVDPEAGTAWVSAGTSWRTVLDLAAPYDLAPLAGSAPQVGAVGYTLGGGMGALSRRYGFAADHVRALEVVTADGSPRRVSPTADPELFWALRGGRGNFGIVTGMTMDLFPVAELYGGGLYFAGEQLAEVLHAYRRWAVETPEEMSSSLALLPFPDLPPIPAPLRGRYIAHIRIAYAGDSGKGESVVRPLRNIAIPLLDTVTTIPYAEVGRIHADPEEPAPTRNQSTQLRELDEAAAETLLSLITPTLDALFAVEIRHLGGALARPPVRPSAVARTLGAFQLYVVSKLDGERDDRIRAAQEHLFETMAPWDTGRKTLNFLSGTTNRSPEAVRAAYEESDYTRLARLKARYDPDNMFRVNHNIPPSSKELPCPPCSSPERPVSSAPTSSDTGAAPIRATPSWPSTR
ncbi:FAD-binding oxidoreductase [Nocardia sp. BMG51109]|uniref:FAD-binding oxidoreductase n=1 Tax=Nocardia sp. BMG51109 TaxID=1056816 RepID=UPI0004674035|nr:FAD-binding oxidoreductase [Nocardia sp. BMG51109]